MVPVPGGYDLVAVLAAAEADVDVHVHLLGGAALVDHVHGLEITVTPVVVFIHGLSTAAEYQLLVSVFAGDVEAALHPQGADPHEGVSPGRGEAVVLLARVVVPLHAGLHPVAPVHVIVRTNLWKSTRYTHPLNLCLAHANPDQEDQCPAQRVHAAAVQC